MILKVVLAFALFSSGTFSSMVSNVEEPDAEELLRLYWLDRLEQTDSIPELPIGVHKPYWNDQFDINIKDMVFKRVLPPNSPKGQKRRIEEAEYDGSEASEFWPYLLNALLTPGDLPLTSMKQCYDAAKELCTNPSATNLKRSDLRAVFKDIDRSGVYTDEGFDAEEARVRQLYLLGYLFLAPAGALAVDEPLQGYVQGMGFLVCYFAWNWPLRIAGPACRRFINIYMPEMYGIKSFGLGGGVQDFEQQSMAILDAWVTINLTKLPHISSEAMDLYSTTNLSLMSRSWLSCMLSVTQNFKQAEYIMFNFLIKRVKIPRPLLSWGDVQYYDPLLVINAVLHHYIFTRSLNMIREMDTKNQGNVSERMESTMYLTSSLAFSSPTIKNEYGIYFDYSLFCQSIDEMTSFMARKNDLMRTYLSPTESLSPSPINFAPLSSMLRINA